RRFSARPTGPGIDKTGRFKQHNNRKNPQQKPRAAVSFVNHRDGKIAGYDGDSRTELAAPATLPVSAKK
ncbi:MAG: hypothetical protein ACXWX7_16270, partial [Candidatus Binatia bacterium]